MENLIEQPTFLCSAYVVVACGEEENSTQGLRYHALNKLS